MASTFWVSQRARDIPPIAPTITQGYTSAWRTDTKVFQDNPSAWNVCTQDWEDNQLVYLTNEWKQFTQVYMRYYDSADNQSYTVRIPRNTAIQDFCNVAAYYVYGMDPLYPEYGAITAFADHNETWLFWITVGLLIAFACLANHSKQRPVGLPTFVLILLAIVYGFVRSAEPSGTGKSWKAMPRLTLVPP